MDKQEQRRRRWYPGFQRRVDLYVDTNVSEKNLPPSSTLNVGIIVQVHTMLQPRTQTMKSSHCENLKSHKEQSILSLESCGVLWRVVSLMFNVG
jgi:hypothetical protein